MPVSTLITLPRAANFTMGLLDIVPVSENYVIEFAGAHIFNDQAGVLTGDNVRKVFDYAKEHKVCVIKYRSRSIF